MPTGGSARYSSPLNVLDFLKITNVVEIGDDALRELGPSAAAIARAEGLTAHALAIEKRLKKLER
jgi:histidinol dehydrogenase